VINDRVLYSLLGATAIAVLTVFFLNTQAFDSNHHTQITDGLREISRVDALLNEQIINSRYQLQHNYDFLNHHIEHHRWIIANLENGPLRIYRDRYPRIQGALAVLKSNLDKKERLLEDFKTDNALFKNSLHHLPHNIIEISEFHDAGTAAVAEEIMREVLIFNLNGEDQLKQLIEQRGADLQARARRLPRSAQEQIANILNHANLIMQFRPTLDRLVNDLLEMPIDASTATLQDSYFAHYRERVALGDRYRIALYVLSTLLLALVVYTLIRLRANSRELFREKERVLVTLHSIGDGVITTDARGLVDFVNPVAEMLTGWTTDEARGQHLAGVFKVVEEHSYKPLDNVVNECLAQGRIIDVAEQALLCRRDGQEFAIEHSVAPIRDRESNIIGAVAVFHDVTKTRSMARELQWHASHDPLTGLANRREFEHRLQVALLGAKERALEHALLYIDLDQFKIVNDTCGHVAGDELLRRITALLHPHVRATDTLARLGGDEFGLLLESCPLAKAVQIADQMRRTLQDFRFVWKNKVFNIGASIGIAPITGDSTSVDQVLSAADVACYAAKDEGRNRVHIYEAADSDIAQRHGEMQWTTRITQAIEEQRFRLYVQRIQPLQPSVSGETHHELLLRMIDESGEIVPPGAFIPAAERYNMMNLIDRWVVSTVCEQLRTAHTRATDVFAVNLSGQSLSDEHFLDFVVQQVKDAGSATCKLCFEITETAAIAHLPRAMRFIHTLRGMGCKFALDDFGMGLSSYAYLKSLPVDYLKIDGTFVKDMHDDPVDRELVRSVNQIAHVIGIKTIAECVETEAVWQRALELKIDFAQGYFIEKPRLWLSPVNTGAVMAR
jgi:diguanylate cyclase (GGDEF)-like protein/PAS domain S-box-containing protein